MSGDYMVGDLMEVEMKSGRLFKLPIVEIIGEKIWLDDGKTRLQLNEKTGKILVLRETKQELEYQI